MKEEIKAKEKPIANLESFGTMPEVGAMQNMQQLPSQAQPISAPQPVQPVQAAPNANQQPVLPQQASPQQIMPEQAMPQQIFPQMQPQMICCPFLMNMQCPMLYNQGYMNGISPAPNMQYMPSMPQAALPIANMPQTAMPMANMPQAALPMANMPQTLPATLPHHYKGYPPY